MCDQTEVNYKEGDIVWVKLGCYFWPGEVQDVDKLDEEILVSFKKKPIAAVKFFDEDKYEYVKNLNQICLYNCRKKHDYIKKGLDMYRKQKEGSYMDKFPDDVRKAEMRTGGDPDILSDPQFQPQEKPNYQGLFGSEKKGKHSTPKQVSPVSTNGRKSQPTTPVRNPPRLITITHPRFIKNETEHKVHIRQQPISSPETGKSPPVSANAPAAYQCHLCDFTSNRLNVIVLHNKFHSANSPNNNAKGKIPPTKIKTSSPKVRANTASAEAKSKLKPKAKSPSKEPEALSKTGASNLATAAKVSSPPKSKTGASSLATAAKVSSPPKVSAIKRKIVEVDSALDTKDIEKEKAKVSESPENKRLKVKSPESPEKKRQKTIVTGSPVKKIPTSPEKSQETLKSPVSGKRKGSRGDDKAAKKIKNDEEIREKLLADWDDEDAEQEEKEMELLKQKLSKGDNGTPSNSNEVSTVTKSGETKAASCFDFDDSKDAILDSELEERAKKFVENRKVPRVIDEKADKLNNKQVVESPTTIDSSAASQPEMEGEKLASAEDFDKAINNLLAETSVPKVPEVPLATLEPCKSSSLLPDVVLDSSLAVGNENKSVLVEETPSGEIQGGDHDYSAKQKDDAVLVNTPFGDDDILDINSMPVVMADAVITDEPSTSQVPLVNIQMPKIDLIPNADSTNTHTIVMTDGRLEMPPSVQSVVKAVRASTTDRSKPAVKTVSQVSGTLTKVTNRAGQTLSTISRQPSTEKLTPARGARLLQQGIASGKYVIVQPTGTAQPRLTPKSSTPQQVTSIKPLPGSSQQQINVQSPGSGKLVIITKPQSGGQQQVLTALTPAQQKALIAGGKLPPPPQRLLTSTGQLLTPVNPRNVMPKGTKLTPITGQQIRAIAASSKQTLGPKLQMQSLQTKIILPTMETVKMPHTQPQPVVRMVTTTTGKPQANTILIQATQGSSVLSSIVSKVSTSTSQLSPRLTMQPKQQRPRLLTSATMLQQAAGKPAPILPSNPKVQQTKQVFQPRMLLQKSRPAMLGNVRSEIQAGSPVPKLVPRSQVISQVTQAQVSKQFTTKSTVPSLQKPIQTKPPLLGSTAKVTTMRQTVQKQSHSSQSIPRTTMELMTTQALPPLAPMQLTTTSSNEVMSLTQAPIMSLPSFQASGSEQLLPTSTATLGDAPTPTYMLLTIDESGNLQPYNSQSLISYDGSDQAGQTIYIDGLESGGDLDNIILTIGNSSSLALDMGQTNTMTNVSSIYNTRAPSSSQDILAAALANTDVFQSEVPLQDSLTVVSSNRSTVMTPCVVESSVMLTSPPSSLLLPSLNRAADVSETSLTLNQPIMTPLELPSTVVPSRTPAPVSFPIDLPLTVTQSLTVPMSSYTVMDENMPTSESIFQPSMPLLSEEISDARTTTSSHLPHGQITYDAIQEHSQLSPYNDTIQIVQDNDLPHHKRLSYQSPLTTQTLGSVQSAQQSNSFFNLAPSEESQCATSTVLTLSNTTIPAEISEETSGISHLCMPASKALDTSTELYKATNSLPPVLATKYVHENCPTKDMCTEDLSVLQVQPLEASNSQIPKFLHTQMESNTAQHSFEGSLQTVHSPDPSNDILASDSSHNNIMKSSEEVDNTINVLTISQQNESTTVRVSLLDEAKNACYVSVANNISHSGLSVTGSNIINHLDIPLPPPRTATATEPMRDGSPHSSMPLLSEEISANSKKQLEDYENSESLSKGSQDSTDSSLNETRFGGSGR